MRCILISALRQDRGLPYPAPAPPAELSDRYRRRIPDRGSRGFISPSSFEGISSAIISGSLLAESFGNSTEDGEIARLYHRKTFRLRCKLTLKIAKRWFMYTPLVREWIMRTGVGSIRLWHK